MANFGGGEMLVIFLLALIVLGPERLPKVARQAGQVMRQVRQMSSGFQEELRTAFEDPQPSDFHGSSTAARHEAAVDTPAELPAPEPDASAPEPSPNDSTTVAAGDRRLSAVPEPTAEHEIPAGPDAGIDPIDPSAGSRAAG